MNRGILGHLFSSGLSLKLLYPQSEKGDMQAGEVTGPRCCKVSPGLYASSYRRCAPATLYEASHEHREH